MKNFSLFCHRGSQKGRKFSLILILLLSSLISFCVYSNNVFGEKSGFKFDLLSRKSKFDFSSGKIRIRTATLIEKFLDRDVERARVYSSLFERIVFSVENKLQEEPPGDIQIVWTQISEQEEFGPIGNEIQDLVIGPSGALWVATNNGLSRFSNRRFRHFTRKSGMEDDQIFTVIPAGRGIFAGTEGGLYWFDDLAQNEALYPLFFEQTDGAINSIVKQEKYILFLITPRYDNSKLGRIELNADGTPNKNSLVIYQFPTQIRLLLPGGGENCLFCQVSSDRRWKQCEVPRTSLNGTEVRLGELLDSDLIDVEHIGHEMLLLTKYALQQYNKDNSSQGLSGLDDEEYSEGFLAKNHNHTKVWLGNKENLWLFDPITKNIVEHFRIQPGMKLKAIAEESNGRLWVGTENNGLFTSLPDKRIGWVVPSTRAVFKFKKEEKEFSFSSPIIFTSSPLIPSILPLLP